MEDMIRGIEAYYIMFDLEKNEVFLKEVSEEELLGVLKSFKNDKSLGPDGWTIELFSHFFEIIKMDLLGMIEESKNMGYIHQNISSTYIALIPKNNSVESFSNYRPISL